MSLRPDPDWPPRDPDPGEGPRRAAAEETAVALSAPPGEAGLAAPCPTPRLSTGGSGGAGMAGRDDTAPPPEEGDPETSVDWIEIVLVDRLGYPQSFEEYEVVTPSGDTVLGLLDEDGFARLDGLTPGDCVVTFPRFDRRLWRRLA